MINTREKLTSGISLDDLIIEPANVHSPESAAMLERLTAELAARYNDDGVGDFRPTDLDQPRSGFLVARRHGAAVACGAYRPLDAEIGEIKRMYVEPAYRGQGLGKRLLEALESQVREEGFIKVWLETGTEQPEALRLYEATGYRRIEPYGFYRWDPRSVCFEKVFRVVGSARPNGAT